MYIIIRISIPFFTNPLRHLPSPPVRGFFRGHLDFNGGKPPTDNVARDIENTPNDGLVVVWGPLYLLCEVIVTRPDLIMDVLNAHSYDWEKMAMERRLLAKFLGYGLVNVEGNEHRSMRKVVAPAFSGHQIRQLVPLFYERGVAFADVLAQKARQSVDGVVEVMTQMSHVTLDIIGAAGIGTDFKTIQDEDNPVAKLYATMMGDRGPLGLFLLVNMTLPLWLIQYLRGTVYAKIADAQVQLRIDLRALLQAKKRSMQDKAEQQKDIIATIMTSGDFSDDYLVDQLLTYLAAGHDTTASALTWTTWLLALNPQIQDRLRAECNSRLADKTTCQVDAIDFEVGTMPYLIAVCNETLRLYPPAPATGRQAVRPTTIGSHLIPQGTRVMVPFWSINRSPALWGDDADEYNPDRWLDAPNAANGGAKSPYAFTTFSHGPRSCIGQTFARTEMKCLLAALIMRFRFELADPDEKVEVGGFITIKPHNGMRLRLHDLKAEAEVGDTADADADA